MSDRRAILLLTCGALVTSLVTSFTHSCPTYHCYCFRGHEIDCVDMGLSEIPFFKVENKTYFQLDLGRNRIKRLAAYAFKNVRVRKIKVWRNRRSLDIHPKAFRGLEDVVRSIQVGVVCWETKAYVSYLFSSWQPCRQGRFWHGYRSSFRVFSFLTFLLLLLLSTVSNSIYIFDVVLRSPPTLPRSLIAQRIAK